MLQEPDSRCIIQYTVIVMSKSVIQAAESYIVKLVHCVHGVSWEIDMLLYVCCNLTTITFGFGLENKKLLW